MRIVLVITAALGAAAVASPVLAADAGSPYTFWLSRTDGGISTKGEGDFDWDAQAWVGGDENRAWFKTTGNVQAKGPDRAEVQALYSHAVSEFWDLQAGVRQTIEPGQRTSAVLGIQGLAPYWFEVDAAGYLADNGRLSARLDASYELTFTQKIFAEPFATIRLADKADPKLHEGAGLTDTEAGLRLRYEFSRKVAPYIGVSWQQRYGETKRLWTAAGGGAQETSFLAGLRLLF